MDSGVGSGFESFSHVAPAFQHSFGASGHASSFIDTRHEAAHTTVIGELEFSCDTCGYLTGQAPAQIDDYVSGLGGGAPPTTYSETVSVGTSSKHHTRDLDMTQNQI